MGAKKLPTWTENTGSMPVPPDTIVWVKSHRGHVEQGRAGDYWWHSPPDPEKWQFLVKEWKHVEET
jgi:hypothetical protein